MGKLRKHKALIAALMTIFMISNFTFSNARAEVYDGEGGANVEQQEELLNNNETLVEDENSNEEISQDNEISNDEEINNEEDSKDDGEKEEETVEEDDDINNDGTDSSISSSDKPSEGYTLIKSEYIEYDTPTTFSVEESKRVLLIEDNLPWHTNTNQVVLSGITEYDLVSTEDFLSVDLSKYGVVVFANDQSFQMYENYKNFKEYLEKFASIGGVIVFGACDSGWAEGVLSEALPGEVKKTNNNSFRNYVADNNHPIVTGELTDNQVLLDEDLYENWASHVSFNESSLPAGSKIILTNEEGNPTLVEYPLGKGRVIASGLTWEYNYVHGGEQHPNGGNRGQFAKKAMDDLFTYAIRVSKIDVTDIEPLKEYWINNCEHNIFVGDKDGFAAIKDAEVKINGQTVKTDKNGIATFVGISGECTVEVTAEGYKRSKFIYNVNPGTLRAFYLDKVSNNGTPYITMVLSKNSGTDLLHEREYFFDGSEIECSIKLDGEWNGATPGKYIIYQEDQSISTETGVIDFAPGKTFDAGKKIYVIMVSADGKVKSKPREILLTVNDKSKWEIESDDALFTLFKDNGFKIESGLPIIAGSTIKLSLDFIPFTVIQEENKVKIAFGIEPGNGVEKWYDDLKDKVDDLKETKDRIKKLKEVMKTFGAKSGGFTLKKGFSEPEFNLIGYAEGVVDDDGNLTKVKGSLVGDAGIEYKYNQQFVVGPVPVYFEIGGGGKVELASGVSKVTVEPQNLVLDLALTITPKFTIGGGAGINGAISVGAEGNVELPLKIDFTNEHFGGQLIGSAKLKASLMFVFTAETPSIKGTWVVVDNYYGRKKILEGNPSAAVYNSENFVKLDRSYLEKDGAVSLNDISDENLLVLENVLLPSSSQNIETIGDKQIAVYQVDDPNRNDNNRTKLVYSVCEEGVWSEAKDVWNNGAPDFDAVLKAYNDELYLVWQKAAKELPNDGDDLENQINKALELSEIAFARWDNNTNSFVDFKYLTNNERLDMSPSIAIDNDEIYVSWVSSDSNIFEDSIDNEIVYTSSKKNNVWSKPEVLVDVNSNISSIDSSIVNNKLNVAYGVDTDNNISTYDDIEIMIATDDNITQITSNEAAEFNPTFYDGKLYWYSNNDLMSYDFAKKTILAESIKYITQNYNIINHDGREIVIWLDSVTEELDSIRASVRQDDGWSKPVKVYEATEAITNYDGCVSDDGKWNIIMNLVNESDEDEIHKLVAYIDGFNNDISLEAVNCDETIRDGVNQPIDILVKNNGLKDITNFKLAVYDTSNVLISEKNVECNIAVGESTEISDIVNVGDITGKKDLVIKVEAEGEKNLDDNSRETTIGYTDVKVKVKTYEIGDQIIIDATVSNASAIPANAAISIIEDREDGIVLDMKNIGLITSEEDYLYRYSVDKNNINYNGERYKSYYIKVDCLEEERIKANNVESVVIDSKEFESYDGEPGPDITIIKATGVEITPSKDITLNLADSKTYKLEANVYPENASNKGVIWQCADNKVAIVDQNGNVEAKGPGTTEIKVITRDGEFTDICKVTVVESEGNEPGGDNNKPGEGNTDPDTPGGDNNKPGEGNTDPDTPGGDNNKPGEGNTDPDTPSGDNNNPGDGNTEPDTPGGDNNKPGDGNIETDTPSGDNNKPGGGNAGTDTPSGDNNEQGDDNTIIVKPGENNNNSSNNQNGSNNQNNESSSIPTTGQENYMWLIAIILIAVGVGLTVYKKKKKI